MNRRAFVAANWRLPLMPDHDTSPLPMKTLLPITGRRADRTGPTEKCRV
jgi:hypothetical protein